MKQMFKRALGALLSAAILAAGFAMPTFGEEAEADDADAPTAFSVLDFAKDTNYTLSGVSDKRVEQQGDFAALMGKALNFSIVRPITPALNMADYELPYLAMRLQLYVEDPSLLSASGAPQLELTSSGTCDKEEIHWLAGDWSLKRGWNDLTLEFGDGSITGGTPNLAGINYFRLYLHFSAETTVGLGDLRVEPSHGGARFNGGFTVETPTLPGLPLTGEAWVKPQAYSGNRWVISDCDGNDGMYDSFAGSNLRPVTSGGKTYLQVDYGTGEYCSLRRANTGEGLVTVPPEYTRDQLALSLRMYVEDVALLNQYQYEMEIASGGMDKDELSWGKGALPLQNGWNDLLLPLAEAPKETGHFTVGPIRWFRFYANTITDPAGHNTICLDDIAIVRVAPQTQWIISEFDNTDSTATTSSRTAWTICR